MSETIRVLIVDDHEMVREGLANMLKIAPDLELVGQASDGEHALMFCMETCPDVILMDLVMPRVDGITATKRIKEVCPQTQIIALTSFSEDNRIQEALKVGIIGYLLKNIPSNQLAEAVRNAHAGKSTLAPEAAQALIHASIQPQQPGFDLTERELEVLSILVDGMTNAQIAQKLEISLSTAKFHVSTILSKLNASSRTEAVSLALKLEIVVQK
ncbi:MAG: DNA-binding response regulator [Anaerolineaceae bacterium]|nr:DNA-binding response regulator [Anaerolineaceae bacterium]